MRRTRLRTAAPMQPTRMWTRKVAPWWRHAGHARAHETAPEGVRLPIRTREAGPIRSDPTERRCLCSKSRRSPNLPTSPHFSMQATARCSRWRTGVRQAGATSTHRATPKHLSQTPLTACGTRMPHARPAHRALRGRRSRADRASSLLPLQYLSSIERCRWCPKISCVRWTMAVVVMEGVVTARGWGG